MCLFTNASLKCTYTWDAALDKDTTFRDCGETLFRFLCGNTPNWVLRLACSPEEPVLVIRPCNTQEYKGRARDTCNVSSLICGHICEAQAGVSEYHFPLFIFLLSQQLPVAFSLLLQKQGSHCLEPAVYVQGDACRGGEKKVLPDGEPSFLLLLLLLCPRPPRENHLHGDLFGHPGPPTRVREILGPRRHARADASPSPEIHLYLQQEELKKCVRSVLHPTVVPFFSHFPPEGGGSRPQGGQQFRAYSLVSHSVPRDL